MILRKNEVLETLPPEVRGTASSMCASSHPEPAIHVGNIWHLKPLCPNTHTPQSQNKNLVFLTISSWQHPTPNYSNRNTGQEMGGKPLHISSIYCWPLNVDLNCTGPLIHRPFSINAINVFSPYDFLNVFSSLFYCNTTVYNIYNIQNVLIDCLCYW